MSEASSHHCSNCEEEQLEALYRLNILAKQYANSASDAYSNGLKEQAYIHSKRKTALYGLKDAILTQYVRDGCVGEIERHRIDGKEYYCLYLDSGYSFHSPVDQWKSPPEGAPEGTTELDSFNADPESRDSELTEREALTRLSEQFESPNHHLEAAFTSGNYPRFVGWSSLPGALAEGDKVPERHLLDHNGEEDFVFELGDTFETGEGQCEIVDRYHAYLTPMYDRSPLLQRPAYDVLLDGERRECITERRMDEQWHILANSIENPLPNVDGQLGNRAGNAAERRVDGTIDFTIGDILELEPYSSEGDPMYCRLTELHVSGSLLFGQYEPVPPSEDAPQGRSIEEIADDVVQVHEEPPAMG